MKVLIADDSMVIRMALLQILEQCSFVTEVIKVSDGLQALEKIKSDSSIDAAILDIEMPKMDGIEATKNIRKINSKIRIIIFSTLTTTGSKKTVEALTCGADDFCPKASGTKTLNESLSEIKENLIPKLEVFNIKKRSNLEDRSHNSQSQSISKNNTSTAVFEKSVFKIIPQLICIGSSTGGPEALLNIFSKIQKPIRVPILLVQHMPPVFTLQLASQLDKVGAIRFKEAANLDKLTPNLCLLAPGDYHMEINSQHQIQLNQDDKECFVRPSVNKTFRSVQGNFKGRVLSLILTGMGEDGALEAAKMHERGDYVYVQNKESSVVWGMAGATKKNVPEAVECSIDRIVAIINSFS